MHVVNNRVPVNISGGIDSSDRSSSDASSRSNSTDSYKFNADRSVTDFSYFDQKESMQIVPPAINFALCQSRTMSDEKRHDFVSKFNKIELAVVRQPEEQHRARYMSEGSRGAVKDKSGKSYCTISLFGYCRPVVLEIFAATAHGPIQPHPLYQVIAVSGKSGSATQCREYVNDSGVKCLQVMLRPENKMTSILDCVGILKICSYNLKRKLSKQNRSATVRLAFQTVVPHPTDRKKTLHLQTATNPIVCVQQLGYPDVSKISLRTDSVKGGSEIFIIGKNFSNSTVVRFREYGQNGCVVWTADACIEKLTRHSCHLICYAPAYRLREIATPVEVYLTVECGSKASRPISFTYTPDIPMIKSDPTPVVLGSTLEPSPPTMSSINVNVNEAEMDTAKIPEPIDVTPTLLTIPTLELGFPGQLDSIDACINMSGLEKTADDVQPSCFPDFNSKNELNSFGDTTLTSFYADNTLLFQ